jgi:putative ABC transport system substrate-binding protein
MIRRREFITLLGGAAAAWPLAARAQQGTLPVIGYLTGGSEVAVEQLAAFRRGLQDAGYREGENVAIAYRWAEDQYERLPALADDLVTQQVRVIAAIGIPAAQAAKAATSTIPIVFTVGGDPVEFGLVAGLARPGGNLTGVSSLSVDLGSKRLELLHELIPAVGDVWLLINSSNPNAEFLSRDAEAAARALKLGVHILSASTDREFDQVFATLAQQRARALVIGNGIVFNARAAQLGALALAHRIPAIFQYREFAAAGGIMSYGGSIEANSRPVGAYAGRILKGEKPADLPVQQATKIELILNLRTAKAFGLDVPITLLGRADEVIE